MRPGSPVGKTTSNRATRPPAQKAVTMRCPNIIGVHSRPGERPLAWVLNPKAVAAVGLHGGDGGRTRAGGRARLLLQDEDPQHQDAEHEVEEDDLQGAPAPDGPVEPVGADAALAERAGHPADGGVEVSGPAGGS